MKNKKKLLNTKDMRRLLTETELPSLIADEKKKILASLPPRPALPEGVPQDWEEALFTPGPCALPLWNGQKWHFCIFCDGEPIIDKRTGATVAFDTYDEAIKQVKGYFEWRKNTKPA